MSISPDGGGAGAPFGTEYQRGAGVEQPEDRLRQRVSRQVYELVQRRNDPVLRRQAETTLRSKRARLNMPEFVVLPDPDGRGDTFHIPGEIIVTTRTWRDEGARAYLTARGLVEADELGCDDLTGELVRLVSSAGTQDLDDTVTELRMRGFAASLTHMAPLARPVVKGLGGPALGPSLEPFEQYPKYGNGGEAPAPVVAVIDTGITSQSRSDGWLESIERTPDHPSVHGGATNVDPLDALPAADNYLDYAAGHGTFVAGIIQQVAPGAKIMMYRALQSDGVGTELEVACAMIRAVKDGAQIINLSLGCQTRFDSPSLPIAAALDVIARHEKVPGETVIIASAGNYGDSRPTWPAAFRRVVSVGGLAPDLRPTAWSSRGFWVDCATVGEGVLSTFVEGSESYEFTPHPDDFGPDSFARWSGTSFSAPQVAGAAARLVQERGITPRQALAVLIDAGDPVPDFGQALSILPGL